MAGRQRWQESRKAKYDMETFDEVLVGHSKEFMDKAKKDGKPFFIWHNTTRMHVFTYISPKYQAMMNSKDNYGAGGGRHGPVWMTASGQSYSIWKISERPRTPSSSSPPTTAPKYSLGRTAA